tara:strand:+ start:1989 stop:2261 length:273 start_codon:yes stop_codon:yes gene_type:complete
MSWDELMNAVVLIENGGFEFSIIEDRIKVRHNTDHSTKLLFEMETGTTKRDAIYQGIKKFERITDINILNSSSKPEPLLASLPKGYWKQN